MIHPDNDLVESWEAEGCVEKMCADFEGWEPRHVFPSSFPRFNSSSMLVCLRVQKLIALVSTTLNWKMFDRDPLKTWVHSKGLSHF
jgi:salicylate hydroxylase